MQLLSENTEHARLLRKVTTTPTPLPLLMLRPDGHEFRYKHLRLAVCKARATEPQP